MCVRLRACVCVYTLCRYIRAHRICVYLVNVIYFSRGSRRAVFPIAYIPLSRSAACNIYLRDVRIDENHRRGFVKAVRITCCIHTVSTPSPLQCHAVVTAIACVSHDFRREKLRISAIDIRNVYERDDSSNNTSSYPHPLAKNIRFALRARKSSDLKLTRNGA